MVIYLFMRFVSTKLLFIQNTMLTIRAEYFKVYKANQPITASPVLRASANLILLLYAKVSEPIKN